MIAGLDGPPPSGGPRVLLVSMPFAAVSTPSLALGLLKAELAAAGIACDVLYLNVLFAQMVGWTAYSVVERCSALLAGEQMFARDLFGDRIPSDDAYDREVLARFDPQIRQEVLHLRAHVPVFLESCLERVAWGAYDVIGFSSVFEQNLPSLSLARRIKERQPRPRIVFGGANCEGIMGRSLHRLFPFVDYVCTGEADHAFPELVRRIVSGRAVDGVRGVVHRRDGASLDTGPAARVTDLDSLPVPDFDDYYEIVEQAGAPAAQDRQVVVETARGCWWGEKAQCTFCGLNGAGIAFRAKSPQRAIDEIVSLARRHGARFVRTVDNMMSPSYYDTFLPGLAAVNPGVGLFYEVRPTLDREQVRALARAGVTNVQAGIESLSTPILKLMKKGTTALRNVEFLKQCRQAGVFADWNLLFGFPGERVEHYEQTLELARSLTHLQAPASVGEIRLDRFSPNFEQAEARGFTNVRPWSRYAYAYPFDPQVLMDLVYYFDCERREPFDDRGALGRVVEQVTSWQARTDVFTARRAGGVLVIQDGRAVAPARTVRLEGLRADVYEICDTRQTPSQVQERLARAGVRTPSVPRIRRLLDELVARRLVLEEHGFYLSLALMGEPGDAPVRPAFASEAVLAAGGA